MKYSIHALKRCQKRGIPLPAIEFIVNYGIHRNTHGAKKFFIPKKAMNSLKFQHREFFKSYDKFIKNTAVVCDGEVIITAMKITKRI